MSYHQRQSPAGGDEGRDPSSGGLFNVNYKKHEDLKEMLDQNKDSLKLEAMKRIIGMIAKGKNASMLFPAVVKNVACKNIEVKKLVYVYLERYAEEQQDLALLSISTFQRGLKDPNQLIRASALRVLSSIRIEMIVPIMLLSIKEGVSDMSPFVRKTAAYAIPKLYSLDPDQKDSLVEIIDKLLRDRTTLVAGSVVIAFQEVCPERVDLVHKHYRHLCSLLVDVDEWGQIAILSMLTRYARTQFLDPNKFETDEDDADKPFYEEEENSDEEDNSSKEKTKKLQYIMDHDHRLLLKSSKPLLQSRNAAVVMSVAQLYYHLAPRQEVSTVAKALVRLLRGRREVQAIVLQNIASMTLKRKGIFGPHLKSFYVRSSDPTHVRVLKLEVLTNLASETNISIILREFQTYVRSSDKQFVAHTIQAIARCATNITEVTDTCLSGLVSLLSNRDEAVVAESIVVIKKLLQMNPSQHSDIIKHMARLLDNIQVPMARASILWLIGEYSEFVPKIAPDVLRKAAKSFTAQEDIVKLQIVNLAAKLFVTNQKQTKLLTQYVLQLAKYDQNYDIRDRSRFLRHLILPTSDAVGGPIHKHAKKILLAPKPAPVLESPFKGRDVYQLGSLSHAINSEASGYQKLPEFPETQPDASVRDVELPVSPADSKKKAHRGRKPVKKQAFYSDEDISSDEEEEESSSGTEDSDSDSSGSETGSESDTEASSSSETGGPDSQRSDSDVAAPPPKMKPKKVQSEESDTESDSDSDSYSESESSSEESSDSVPEPPKPSKAKQAKSKPTKKKKEEVVNLLDLDDFDMPPAPAATNKGGTPSILTPMLTADLQGLSLSDSNHMISEAASTFSSTQSYELLHRVTGAGLSAKYRYTRSPCIYGDKMITVEIEFHNSGESPVEEISMGAKKLQAGLKVHDFKEIDRLNPGAFSTCTFGVDFCDTTQPLVFDLCTKTKRFNVSIKVPVGELVKPVTMPQTEFLKQQGILSGMNENKCKINIPAGSRTQKNISRKIIETVNVCTVPSTQDDVYRFAGKTAHGGSMLLVTVQCNDSGDSLCVNCEKMVICSMVFKQLKEKLLKDQQ